MSKTMSSQPPQPRTSRRLLNRIFWKAASAMALSGLYTGDLDDRWMQVQRRAMPLAGLGSGFDGCTIAHISDLHLCAIVREAYLLNFVEAVNEIGVDFVAITGDMVTGHRRAVRKVVRLIGQFQPRIATLACLGNHDYGMWHPRGYGGRPGLAEYLSDHLLDAGVHLMNNHSHIFRQKGAVLQFVGLEDLWTNRYDPAKAFRRIDPTRPTVALVHNPDAAPELAALGAQWVLAGHTHGKDTRGSLRRMALPSRHRHFVAGQYPLGDEKYLYVNRGLGHSRRRRLGDRPEITLFTLRRQAVLCA